MNRCWAEVDLGALRHNLAWIRHRLGPGVKVITVVKADAYGHGLKEIAAVLMRGGTDIFGVANVEEGLAVRKVGRGWPVLLLGATLPDEMETAIRHGLMPTLSSLEEANAFSDLASKLGSTVEFHLKVDTGMSRLGADPTTASELMQLIGGLNGLRCGGIYTHFASAEDDAEATADQRLRFDRVVRSLRSKLPEAACVHAANSAGLLLEPLELCNAVRPGLLVYGVLPQGQRHLGESVFQSVQPAMSWKCRIGLLKTLSKGTKVSYGQTFTATRELHAAVVTAGYGDGLMRAGSNRVWVLVGGKRCPVLGRITMDQTVVDVTSVSNPKVGDEVVIIGAQGEGSITANELASWCGSIPWEILTNISYRVPRVYLGGQAA